MKIVKWTLFILLLATPLAHADTSTGLVGWWRMDEGSGSTVYDSSVNGNSGTLSSPAPSWTVGKLGGALSFNGSNQYVLINGSSAFKPTTTLTISAWINPSSTGTWNKALIFPYGASSWTAPYDSYQIALHSGKYSIGFTIDGTYTDGDLDSANTCPLNTWTHVVGTFNSGIIKFYVNGALDFTQDVTVHGTQVLYTTRTQPVIGTDAEYFINESWAGKIDDVRIYNRVLSAADVAQLYNIGPRTLRHAHLTHMKINE